jgi:predicted dehydrogenase
VSIRVGLIGAGNISDTHARAVAAIPDASIAAVYGPTRARAERLAASCGARAHDRLDAFLAQGGMDMVIVGTPSGLHGEHGAAAAAAGLHVLVEKPLEITTARADALIAAAARTSVTLGVIFQDRLKPAVERLKTLVDAGAIGKPILAGAHVKWYRPRAYYAESRWRGTQALDGGGALINQAIHTIDLLMWVFGPVARVFGKVATRLHAIEVEDTAAATLEFSNGAVGTIEAATSAYPGYARRIEITGSEGTAILDGDELIAVDLRGQPEVRPAPDSSQARGQAEVRLVPESASSPVVSDASAHQRVVEDFIAAFRRGAKPRCDGPEGRRSVALIEAIYESSRCGRRIDVT